MRIGVVAEGYRDFEIIEAIVSHVLDGVHTFLAIQPELSDTGNFGIHGGGWKGVRGWCQSRKNDFKNVAGMFELAVYDILIMQIDLDVARENEIACMKPCPPVAGTVEALENMLLQWLGENMRPARMIFCIPADNAEAWILAAFDPETDLHNPPENYLECVAKPDLIISNQAYKRPRRLLKRKANGSVDKTKRTYRDELIPEIIKNWEHVKRICSQAERFEADMKEVYRPDYR